MWTGYEATLTWLTHAQAAPGNILIVAPSSIRVRLPASDSVAAWRCADVHVRIRVCEVYDGDARVPRRAPPQSSSGSKGDRGRRKYAPGFKANPARDRGTGGPTDQGLSLRTTGF